MSTVQVITAAGQKKAVDDTAIEALKAGLRGALLRPGDPGYDTARTLWNAMIDRRPALIAQPAGAADVMRAVTFAAEHGLQLSVRGGGHNIAGNAVNEGGFMIDLSQMRSVRIDPSARRADVGPGAKLGDFDREAQAFGLATPLGINSTTGVAGLTLGGGFGWLSRKHGLTIDNLVSADVVTANGKLVRASAKENQELFWGIRGGGGNFGIVTNFEFQLHHLGPEVYCGVVVYPIDQAKTALLKYRELAAKMPEEMSVWFVLRKAPPLPFLPPETHGKEIIAFACFYAGPIAEGEKAIQPVRVFGTPYGEHLGPAPYAAFQQLLDPLLTPGFRNYWKSHNFTEISDGFIDTAIKFARSLPSPHCELAFAQIGGQASKPKPDATAWPHRNARWVMNIHTRWETPGEDERCIAWARGLFDAMAPHATGGVYVNFMPQDETGQAARITAAYGPNYERLAKLKKAIDPNNLFRMNQNIRPA